MKVCKVLPTATQGHLFNILVNMLLGFLSLSSLVIKRKWFDKRKRSDRVFLLDVGRLAIAGTVGHVLNVLLAHWLDDTETADECKFYLVNYILDLVVGVPLSYVIIIANTALAEKRGWTFLKRRGFYGRPIDYGVWAKQTLEFTLSIALAKTMLAFPLFAFKEGFERLGGFLVEPVQDHPHFELFMVMVLIPTTLNAVQFMIFDQILIDEFPPYDISESSENIVFEPDENRFLIDRKGQQMVAAVPL